MKVTQSYVKDIIGSFAKKQGIMFSLF